MKIRMLTWLLWGVPRLMMDGGDGGTTAPGTTAAPAPGAQPAAPGAAPAAPAPGAWLDGFKDAETRDWVKSLALPDPEAVAVKARNLERFVGADKAGRGVIVPKSDAPREEWTAFYKKLGGVPEKPEGYSMAKETPKEVLDALSKDPMLNKFREYAHKTGMPQQFFQDALGWFVQESQGWQASRDAETETKIAGDLEALHVEWPAAKWDENVNLAQRASRMFVPVTGGDAAAQKVQREEFIGKIEGAIGTAATYRLFASIGRGMAEDKFVGGERSDEGGESAEGARIRIMELMKDKAWTDKLLKNDAEAKGEWTRLHKLAYPGVQDL